MFFAQPPRMTKTTFQKIGKGRFQNGRFYPKTPKTTDAQFAPRANPEDCRSSNCRSGPPIAAWTFSFLNCEEVITALVKCIRRTWVGSAVTLR